MKKMMTIVLTVALLVSTVATADPVSMNFKSGLLQKEDDSVVQVDAGLYLNTEAWDEVKTAFNALRAQNATLLSELDSANKKISDCSPSVPGLPTWATVLISAGLTVISMVAGFFAVREATK